MLFGKTKMELKVGLFVFIGIAILMIFVLSIGGFKTWTSGYQLKFRFDFINGVKLGAPIRFAGVDVGEVKKTSFIYVPQEKARVEVRGWVKKEVFIPRDSTVWVNTLGLLGEKYIEIMPGQDYKNFVLAGDTLEGTTPLAMHELGELAKDVVNNLDAMLVKIKDGKGAIGRLLNEDTLYAEIEALILDLKRHPWKLFWRSR